MVGLRVLRSVHECEPSPMYQFDRYIKLTRPSSHTAPRATAPHCKNATRCIIALVVRACLGCVLLSSEWLKAAPRYRAAPGSPRSRCWGVDCWYCCPAMRQLRGVRLSFSEIGVQLRAFLLYQLRQSTAPVVMTVSRTVDMDLSTLCESAGKLKPPFESIRQVSVGDTQRPPQHQRRVKSLLFAQLPLAFMRTGHVSSSC